MKVLSIDTSTASSVVGLSIDGRVVASDCEGSDQKHAETLLPRIAALLGRASLTLTALDLIAVGTGPGSFTGLRVGLATAKGLSVSASIPLRGVPTLPVLARAALAEVDSGTLLASIDAGRGELFFALYDVQPGGRLRERAPGRLATPDVLASAVASEDLATLTAVGSGARCYSELLEARLGRQLRLATLAADIPQPEHLSAEAERLFLQEGPSSAAALEPLYMRASDAKLPSRPLALD